MRNFVGGRLWVWKGEQKYPVIVLAAWTCACCMYYVPESVQGQELKRPDQYTAHLVKLQPEASIFKKSMTLSKGYKE